MTRPEKPEQEIDAQEATVMARRVTIIMPHYIVLPKCAEGCRQLRRAADEAKLMAVRHPGDQIVVIGDKHNRFGFCNASVYSEGKLMEANWGSATPEDPVFLDNPALYTTGVSGGRSVSRMIKQAFENGAKDYNELPRL